MVHSALRTSRDISLCTRGDVYDVTWWIAKEHYTGAGIVVNDTLSVAYSGGDAHGSA